MIHHNQFLKINACRCEFIRTMRSNPGTAVRMNSHLHERKSINTGNTP